MAKKNDELLDSNYDGIKEYDNDLPKWWSALFIITIIFAVVYVAYFQFGPGLSSEERLAMELSSIKKLQASSASSQSGVSSTDLLTYVKSAEHATAGKPVYDSKCAVCHGPLGQGLIGPNLADEFWIHGNKPEELMHTIEEGVLDKGMLAWKGQLSKEEIQNLVAYIYSLKGSNPPNPKAPQGTLIDG